MHANRLQAIYEIGCSLDYVIARSYGAAQGRFVSPDSYSPILIMQNSIAAGLPEGAARSHFDEFLENPQNWNRYSYVRNRPLNLTDPWGEAPRDGHHLIPNRDHLTGLARQFANAVKTGPLTDNYPNQPGFNSLHRAYNVAAEDMLQQLEQQFGTSRNNWSASQWQQAGKSILNSQNPAIRNFLDLLNKNNAGKASAALASAINAFKPAGGSILRGILGVLGVIGSRFILIIYVPMPRHDRPDLEADRLPPHERCLKRRDGSCV